MHLKEPKKKVLGILFGSSDKSDRMMDDNQPDGRQEWPGIKHGISGGQWESYFDPEGELENKDEGEDAKEDERYKQVGSSSGIGREELEFLPISYNKDSFIRFFPTICLRDLDEASFLPILNKSLAEKVQAIHIFANGYKIQEIGPEDMRIDHSKFDPTIPVHFSNDELKDPWVRIRPSTLSSAFHFRFFKETPKRMYVPEQVQNSLESRKKST